MKKFLSIVLATSLCMPAVAQKSGSANRNAPEVKQSLTAGEAKISLDYTSVAWAAGQTMAALMDKTDAGKEARAGVNQLATAKPIGKFNTSVDVKVGDVAVVAGEHEVYFTIGDDLAWSMNFKNKDKVVTTKLKLEENPGHEHKQLVLSLYAADKTTAGVYVGFGKQSGMLSIAPGGGAKEASGGK